MNKDEYDILMKQFDRLHADMQALLDESYRMQQALAVVAHNLSAVLAAAAKDASWKRSA